MATKVDMIIERRADEIATLNARLDGTITRMVAELIEAGVVSHVADRAGLAAANGARSSVGSDRIADLIKAAVGDDTPTK